MNSLGNFVSENRLLSAVIVVYVVFSGLASPVEDQSEVDSSQILNNYIALPLVSQTPDGSARLLAPYDGIRFWTEKQLGSKTVAIAKNVAGLVPGGSNSGLSSENGDPADSAALTAAAKALRARGGQLCPVGEFARDEYTLKLSGQTGENANLCLKAETAKAVGPSVHIEMIINTEHKGTPFGALSATFRGMADAECLERTAPVRRLGQAYLMDTGEIPRGSTAPVALMVEGFGSADQVICGTGAAGAR